MIIIKLIGGLGNQMFQYAAGRMISYSLNTQLKIDVGAFQIEGVTKRKYELGAFNVQESVASEREIKKFVFRQGDLLNKYPLILRSIEKLSGKSHILENINNPELWEIPDNSYIEGLWKNEKYFKSIEKIIKKDFTLKNKLNLPNKKIASKINFHNSVSIHVRRGDYILNPKISRKYNHCDLEFYKKAVKIIQTKVSNPVFFIFSDDLDWAKHNFGFINNIIFVENNFNKNDAEDLWLMSKCQHNIIANSTFSWWGAWLNQNNNKIIIGPKYWFVDKSRYDDQIMPSSWIKL